MYTMGTLLKHGSDAQKREYLPQIASGKLRLQAFGVTEPTSGTDTTRIRTTAVRDGDVYRVNGQKVFISRTEHSDLMLLLARTTPREQAAKPTDGMSVFIVDLRDGRRPRPHDQAARDDDESRDDGAVLRQSRGAGREPRSASKAKGSATSSTA